MAIKAWAELQSNEVVAAAEVVNAVTNGYLLWKTSNPSLASGYCYTRTDFEAYIKHNSMASSGIATNELMSRSEMEAYRDLAALQISVADNYDSCPEVAAFSITITPHQSAEFRLQREVVGVGSWSNVDTRTTGSQYVVVHPAQSSTNYRYRVYDTAVGTGGSVYSSPITFSGCP
jgi:hypothetical protein